VSRILPLLLRRPANLVSVPASGAPPPARRAGYLHGDPAPWIPHVLARLGALPWTDACDLLLAPAPRPGAETQALCGILDSLPPERTVALYERDWPLWPNLLVHDGGGDGGRDFATPGAGMRAYRAAFRDGGRGFAEALCVLPAQRTADLLRARGCAARGAAAGDPLQNRRFLATALYHQRSAALLAAAPAAAALAPARRVAVIAPHFDDEAIQAGGAILAARDAGAEVRIIWMTDGARGVPGAAPVESTRIRKEEALAAAAALGVGDLHFLDAPEERVRVRGPWTARLRALLEEFAPERTHVVWWADNHVDHYETARVLMAAWPRRLARARIAASGTWAPIPVGTPLPLTAALRARKDLAVLAHASQLAVVDYLRAERGLTRWQAAGLDGIAHAERYWEASADDWFAAFRASGAARRIWLG
jgi:LmbE family N-acetylglucosaminyl deacetylase